MGGDVESALQNTAKMISTVKLLSWTKWMKNLDLPPTPSNQGWENGMFWLSRGFILDFSLFGGGGGVGVGVCWSMIFYLAEKAVGSLELGSRFCICCIFACFRVWLCMIMSLRQKKRNLLPRPQGISIDHNIYIISDRKFS